MFKTLFKWKRKHLWIVTVKNGDIIRLCERTGKIEYRDYENNVWVSVSDANKIKSPSHSVGCY